MKAQSGVGAADTDSEAAPAPAAPGPAAPRLVMVVDDHGPLARVSARLLETLGYRTVAFEDPRLALEALAARTFEVDCLFTDLSMPQLSGVDFVREVRRLQPRLPVVVATGHVLESEAEWPGGLRVEGILLKPWRVEEVGPLLARALRAGAPE